MCADDHSGAAARTGPVRKVRKNMMLSLLVRLPAEDMCCSFFDRLDRIFPDSWAPTSTPRTQQLRNVNTTTTQ